MTDSRPDRQPGGPSPAPAPGAVLGLLLLVLVPAALAWQLLNADGDIARHLRHGRTILAAGDVIRHDPFSFSRAGEPFVGMEYGSQVLLAAAERAGGLPAVVLFMALLVAATFGGMYAWLTASGVAPLAAFLGTCGSALLSAFFWVARPHMLTQLLVIPTLALGWRLLQAPRPALVALAAPLFALWANLHGGWSFGVVLLGLLAAGRWLDDVLATRRLRPSPAVPAIGAAMALGLAATCLTPYGLELPRHVAGFFSLRYAMQVTAEFQRPALDRLHTQLFLAALALMAWGLARGRRPVPWAVLLPVLALTAFAVRAQRNIALFAITAVPIVLLHRARRAEAPPGSGAARTFAEMHARGRTWPWALAGVAAVLALMVSGGRIGSRQVVAGAFDPARFPVAAVERARAAGLGGRLVHELTWGGYVLWAWPGQPVFIDGGTDFYGEPLLRDYVRLWETEPGWQETVDKWGFDVALLPPASRLARALATDPSWREWYRDSTAVILRRDGTGMPTASAAPSR